MALPTDRTPICLCLTGKTLRENLEALDRQRPYVDMVELRADCLVPAEKFLLRSFPEQAGLPTILTVRRVSDGGQFEDGEGVRMTMFAKALSYASPDAKGNFAYVDLESDFHAVAVEDACRTFGTRIIRSVNCPDSIPDDLEAAWADISDEPDEIPRLAVSPRNSADLARLLSWSRKLPERERIILTLGKFGYGGRLVPRMFGSMLAYAGAMYAGMPMGSVGLVDARTFAETFRSREVGPDTKLYALIGGTSVIGSRSPALHNNAFRRAGMDAAYMPLPSDEAGYFMQILEELDVQGASVTVPFKEDVLPFLSFRSVDVQGIGACNTLVRRDGTWAGYNTDADGFERSALEFLGRADFEGLRVTLVGSGGAAKSVAHSLARRGAKCVVLNRTLPTARELARRYGFSYGPLDDRSLDLVIEHSDLIVQATSVGMLGGIAGDPLDWYEFTGREAVFDIIYRPERTQMLERAERAGCSILNGYDMLRYQAAGQFKLWTGAFPPNEYYA